ncbi:Protein of unknown function [Cotesia congregata]|uniref:Uncharacterized protein n=1 Tax=Cotesia congregata TaxID=51543 RepID=A0A8J2MLT4_COTCN|nr:Protein of unknown function [Cotesia congregata]
MQRGGRPKHSFWEEGGFQRIRENGKQVASCVKCKKIINNTAEQRLKSHRKSCIWENSDSISESEDNFNITLFKKRRNRSGSYDDNNNSDLKRGSYDEAATPSSSIQLKKEKHPYFKKFCKILRLAYEVPSEVKLSTTLLEKAHDKFTDRKVNLKEKKGTLLFCKNVAQTNGLEIIAITKTRNDTLFLKSWILGEECDYISNYLQMINESSSIALKKYYISVYAVISFINVSKNNRILDSTSASPLLSESISMWHFNCHLETVDTLIAATHDDSLEIKINRLLNAVKSTDIEEELVKRGGDTLSSVKQDAQFLYYSKLSVCLNNLPLLRQILGEGLGKFNRETTLNIFDDVFENNLKESVSVFDFLSKFITRNSGNDFNIADAIEDWFKLRLLLKNDYFLDIIDNELKKIITPQALTANFLHPLYRGSYFMKMSKYSNIVYEFLIDELDDTGLQELECFKNSKGLFAKLITKTTCSKTLWSIASEQNPNLSMLAQSLLKIPAYTIKFNQYDLGKNLPEKLVPKFTDVFYNLKFMNAN